MIKLLGDSMWNIKHPTPKSTIVSIAYYYSFFVTLETLIGQCYAVCKDYQLSPNGCKNPFNSICDPITNQCTCKDGLSIDFDGYCLQPNGAINEPCWVSDQCLAPKSKCFSKDGKADWILEISNISWSEYVAKNGSESLIPGICLCNFGHVYDSNEDKCIPRLIDTPCINNSQCSKRSSYTRCISSKCNCAVRHLYNPRNDRCVYVGEGIWQRQNCYDSSCRTRNTEQYIYNHSLANVFGFSLSMSLLMLVWVVLRNCHRTRMTERPVRLEELRYSDLRLSYDPFEVAHHNNLTSEENTHRQNRAREHLPPYEDTGPPTYEEAVIKMGENLPSANNNSSNNNNNNNNNSNAK